MSKSVGGGAFLADRGQDVKKAGILEGRRRYECKLFGCRRIGCQEVKLLSVLRTKITSVTSQPSCPPNFCSSDNAPLPQSLPQGREAEKSSSLFTLHLKKTSRLYVGATHVAHFDDIRQDAFNLVKGNTHVIHFGNIRRAAFTLAEVLITLGIIGVVAAMTLPSLIQKYKIQEYVSKLNKFYTVISNAYIMAKNDNGDISGWNLVNYQSSTNDEEDILYYLLPYMNVVKFCGKNDKGCFPDIVYGSIGSAGFRINLNTNSWYSNAILNDGMYISSLTFSNTCGNAYAACALLRVDVNGDAPPNKMGIDLHTFAVYKDRILPGGLSDVLDDEQSINRGDACTAHVIYEKNMDYIKDGKCEIYE